MQSKGKWTVIISFWLVVQLLFSLFQTIFMSMLLPLEVYWWVYVYTLELALSFVHPGPFQLITVTLSFLIAYYVDNYYGLHDG